MTSYRGDPRWITAKYAGRDRAGVPFSKGDRIFYYPLTKTIISGDEARRAAADFEASRADEENYR